LRDGLAKIDASAAQRVRDRAAGYLAAIQSYDEDGLPEGMDEVPCPALDPVTGCCDLYDSRPITCRTFGPAVKTPDGGVASCELCFPGATEEEIAACAVEIEPATLEMDVAQLPAIAFALYEPGAGPRATER
jgi:Fe-S-cluster containining protein